MGPLCIIHPHQGSPPARAAFRMLAESPRDVDPVPGGDTDVTPGPWLGGRLPEPAALRTFGRIMRSDRAAYNWGKLWRFRVRLTGTGFVQVSRRVGQRVCLPPTGLSSSRGFHACCC